MIPSPLVTSLIALACILAGTVLGARFRVILPKHYLDSETKDVVKLSVGLVATLTALVLGLLIATAKSTYDAKDSEIKQITATVGQIDIVLAQYGPDAITTRTLLRRAIGPLVDQIWTENRAGRAPTTAFQTLNESQAFYRGMFQLAPQNETQRSLRDQALKLTADLTQVRLLLFATTGNSIPLPFLIILVFWATVLFASFGFLMRVNPVAISVVLLCAISTSAALFLILDLGQPFSGTMSIASEPLRNSLAPLVQ